MGALIRATSPSVSCFTQSTYDFPLYAFPRHSAGKIDNALFVFFPSNSTGMKSQYITTDCSKWGYHLPRSVLYLIDVEQSQPIFLQIITSHFFFALFDERNESFLINTASVKFHNTSVFSRRGEFKKQTNRIMHKEKMCAWVNA